MKIDAILASVCFALLSCGCAVDATRTRVLPDVPDLLRPLNGETNAFSFKASGVQIYECQAGKNDATRGEWVFKAPEADLFDHAGRKVGTHGKGPVWKHNDGSSVTGEKPRALVKNTNAIPWLLLEVKSNEGGGTFGKVTSIQRVDTTGGRAPGGGCELLEVGREIRVPYTATYYFYIANP